MRAMERIRYDVEGHVARIAFARGDKLNAFDRQMLRELSEAYTLADDDHDVRCLMVHAEGRAFTAGLDLAEVGPAVAQGEALFPKDGVDPLGLHGRRRRKPVVMAIQGYCFTIGIELALASDIRVCAPDATFGQIEINRGIFPFGGATIRWPAQTGWGDAMRWLLTGERMPAAEAHRIGLVQEIADDPAARGQELAEVVASRAPLGVQATLRSAWTMVDEGAPAAGAKLLDEARTLMGTDDAKEGMQSFVERREAKFTGT